MTGTVHSEPPVGDRALALVKAIGKRVVAELDMELESATVETYIASVADEVWVAPAAASGAIGTTGTCASPRATRPPWTATR